jgi:hypothetical protein
MSSDYFDFANKPKGILPFHNYGTYIATPIEEHLYECYYSNSNGFLICILRYLKTATI